MTHPYILGDRPAASTALCRSLQREISHSPGSLSGLSTSPDPSCEKTSERTKKTAGQGWGGVGGVEMVGMSGGACRPSYLPSPLNQGQDLQIDL